MREAEEKPRTFVGSQARIADLGDVLIVHVVGVIVVLLANEVADLSNRAGCAARQLKPACRKSRAR